MKKSLLCLSAGLILSIITFIEPALANEPLPRQLGLQPAATPVMERISDFHNLLLWIISGITAFVLALVLFILLRFNSKVNPEPSKTTHNTMIEVIWTVIPIVILIVIAIPSLKLLYYTDRVENPDMTVKVTGYQWYWSYTYMDENGEFSYDSRMIADEDIDESRGQKRLLSADTQLVLPVGANVRILVTAGPDDVLHSFAVPSFGVKLDAVPGRINETWARIEKPGTYYGQCSELCGQGHAYMPIEVRAVSKENFEAWKKFAEEEYASSYSYDDFKTQQKVRLANIEGHAQ